MATIGTFKKSDDGAFSGAIKTLTLNVKQARIQPVTGETEKSPQFRILAGQTEFGAAWRRKSRDEREYLSVKLDDPSFPNPIYANLVEGEDGYSLIWARGRSAE